MTAGTKMTEGPTVGELIAMAKALDPDREYKEIDNGE